MEKLVTPRPFASHAVGAVRLCLQVEGLGVFAIGLLAYVRLGLGWGTFAALFLVPDLSLAMYLVGPRAGATAYNAMHSYVGPLALAALAILGVLPATLPLAFIWAAHIGLDRALGFGLKYESGFAYTHLGTLAAAGRHTLGRPRQQVARRTESDWASSGGAVIDAT